ncbi:hypothetical protein BDW42DRAFT_199779 [Aspergillus taichungensis]|uniref:Protein kinase domain-containing protein n=1 Tax=Aspergillus taichungensis TaxID=482145 RepID=A0A2J5HD99_9EURO|nr:hypothetical protein BDW42DRAFT_199779 [Aspergillus taichungensis]
MLNEIEVKPFEVEFLEVLKRSSYSVVFKVRFQERIYVMKVLKYHDRGPSEFDPPDREVNLFVSESTAYCRMKLKGLCERGVIPNFSEQRLSKLRSILDDIHKAKVLHGDSKPRNMMVSSGGNDRVLWIDFDSAQTFAEGDLSPRQEKWIEEEVELINYFVDALPRDFNEGRLSRTLSYYYDWYK